MSNMVSAQITPEVMVTPKAYWVDQRLNGYGRWAMPFWRELFQNSVDAKASRIDIFIEKAIPRGAFGEEASVSEVIRVRFSDNGTGMTEDVIRNVFFRPGASAKRGVEDQIGGFGTARIMLCWSQVRYSIQTNGLYVEGDGSRYTCRRIVEEITVRDALASGLEQRGAPDRADLIRQDIETLRAINPRQTGCHFEIDINPKETADRYRNVSADDLRQALSDYLYLSQLPCKVFLNGEQLNEQCRRGQVKRLLAVDIEGKIIDFAKVHLSNSKNSPHKSCILVRVNGAFMFKKYVDFPQQVIVEIEPKMAREILNETRNALVEPYSSALDALQNALAVDRQSALKAAEERKHEIVRGSFGGMAIASAITPAAAKITEPATAGDQDAPSPPSFADMVASYDEELRQKKSVRYADEEERTTSGGRNVGPVAVMHGLIMEIMKEPQTFLSEIPTFLRAEAKRFVDILQNKGVAALAEAEPSLTVWLHREVARRESVLLGERATGIIQMHDLHIHKENLPKDDARMRAALNTYHPSYWRSGTKVFGGDKPPRWSAPHMLFTVWTVCVRYVLDVLHTQHPYLLDGDKPFKFATGWYFGPSEEVWDNKKNSYVLSRTLALHKKLEEGTHVYLLNPILQNGSPAYNLSLTEESADHNEVGGLARLIALAKHEVAHTITDSHNEDYARTLSKLDMAMSELRHIKGIYAAAHSAVEAVKATYGKGRVKIASLDGPSDSSGLPDGKDASKAPEGDRPRRGRKPRAQVQSLPNEVEVFDDETPKETVAEEIVLGVVEMLTTGKAPPLEDEAAEPVSVVTSLSENPDEVLEGVPLEALDAELNRDQVASRDNASGDQANLTDLNDWLDAVPLPQQADRDRDLVPDDGDAFLASLDAVFDEKSMRDVSPPLSSWDALEASITTLSASEADAHEELAALASLVDVSLEDLHEAPMIDAPDAHRDMVAANDSEAGGSTIDLGSLLGEEFDVMDVVGGPSAAETDPKELTEDVDELDHRLAQLDTTPFNIPEAPDLDALFDDPGFSPSMRP